jgi:hypothetical protein
MEILQCKCQTTINVFRPMSYTGNNGSGSVEAGSLGFSSSSYSMFGPFRRPPRPLFAPRPPRDIVDVAQLPHYRKSTAVNVSCRENSIFKRVFQDWEHTLPRQLKQMENFGGAHRFWLRTKNVFGRSAAGRGPPELKATGQGPGVLGLGER